MRVPRAAYETDKRSKLGHWDKDTFIERGIYANNNLLYACNSPSECTKLAAEKEAQARREQAARGENDRNACGKYYSGYVGYIDFNNGKRDIWGQDIGNNYGQFVVIGSGNGNVSVRGTDGGSYPGYNKLVQLTCTRLREIER